MLEKIRLGIIGMGGMEIRHLGVWLETRDVEVVAVADTNEARFSAMREHYPQTESLLTYSDYHTMLDEVGLDAVEISTPHTLHYEQVTAALDRGLHVLVEKPMVCCTGHARDLIERANARERVLMIGYQRHFSPEFRYIKKIIEEGRIGDITFLTAYLGQEWKALTTGTWRQVPSLSGGGQLNDSGSHQLDVILWATGLAAESVQGYIDNLGCEVDINAALSVKFTNGAIGTLNIAGDAPGWYEDFTIIGTKGAIYYRNGNLLVQNEKGEYSEPADLPVCGEPGDGPVQGLLKGFARCIQGKDVNWVPPTCGLRVIELTEAAWRSAQTGQPVKVAQL